MTAFIAWVLALFLVLAPKTPWSDTYERSAAAIVRVSAAAPLFAGATGPEKTAATLAALAWFESSLRPDAEGDCTKDGKPVASVAGRCPPGAIPHSFCLFQIGESNFAGLGITREQIQTSVDVCADAAIKLAHVSFGVCRGRPLEERLGHYASGGETCAGLAASRHRMAKGTWLYQRHPPPAP